jgi:hypothetical protein
MSTSTEDISLQLKDYTKQNVEFDWLTFLIRIWKVLRSDLNPEADYPDYGVSRFASVSHTNAEIVP